MDAIRPKASYPDPLVGQPLHGRHIGKLDDFQANAAKWAQYVKDQDKQAFKDNMTDLKKKFAENNTSFGQAYENMYKIMEWL